MGKQCFLAGTLAHIMKMKSILYLICLVPLISTGQEVPERHPVIGNFINLSTRGEIEFLKHQERCESIWNKMTTEGDYEKLSNEDRTYLESCSEVEENYWDIIDGGCSWYCGGGPESVTASSTLHSSHKGIRYAAENAHDLSYKTAWVEGDTSYGIGEFLLYRFNPASARINKIIVVNGYVKNQNAWQNNSRVKKLKMYIDEEPYAILNLKDTRSEQEFSVKPIGLNHDLEWEKLKNLPPWTMKFEILEVYPGAKYKDVAITEIYFDGLDVHCLVSGTQITMADGAFKPIEGLKVGDKVMSLNSETQKLESSVIEGIESSIHCNLIRIEFSDGRILSCTPDHPVKLDDGKWSSFAPDKTVRDYQFQNVGQLKVSDKIWDVSSKEQVEIVSIETHHKPQLTFTIVKLNRNKSFIANGVVVGTEELKVESALSSPSTNIRY